MDNLTLKNLSQTGPRVIQGPQGNTGPTDPQGTQDNTGPGLTGGLIDYIPKYASATTITPINSSKFLHIGSNQCINDIGNGMLGYGNAKFATSLNYNSIMGCQSLGSLLTSSNSVILGGGNFSLPNITNVSNSIIIGTTSPLGFFAPPIINDSTYIGNIALVPIIGTQVVVSANDQLGIAASAQRFKHDIVNMKDTSFIYNLTPRNFKFIESMDSSQTEQYGLIAEEVEQTLGAEFLVVYDGDVVNYPPFGRTLSVRYDNIPILILNELIRLKPILDKVENLKGEEIEARIGKLEVENGKLKAENENLRSSFEQVMSLYENLSNRLDLIISPTAK